MKTGMGLRKSCCVVGAIVVLLLPFLFDCGDVSATVTAVAAINGGGVVLSIQDNAPLASSAYLMADYGSGGGVSYASSFGTFTVSGGVLNANVAITSVFGYSYSLLHLYLVYGDIGRQHNVIDEGQWNGIDTYVNGLSSVYAAEMGSLNTGGTLAAVNAAVASLASQVGTLQGAVNTVNDAIVTTSSLVGSVNVLDSGSAAVIGNINTSMTNAGLALTALQGSINDLAGSINAIGGGNLSGGSGGLSVANYVQLGIGLVAICCGFIFWNGVVSALGKRG